MMIRIAVASLSVAAAELYCPDETSFDVGGGASWNGNGWTTQGSGAVQGHTSFNLLGGYVEFDVDNSGVQFGVNNNFYTISPDHPYQSYNDYCDGEGPDGGSPTGTYCVTLDIFEANGHSNLATMWHTFFNHDGGCDKSGCESDLYIGGKFHVKAEFGSDGFMHVYFDGNENYNFTSPPSDAARQILQETMGKVGVTFQSSQWTGWVPGAGSVHGDLANSRFSITNIKVSGAVLMGPVPPKCGDSPSPTPTPTPTPVPIPTPTPTPSPGRVYKELTAVCQNGQAVSDMSSVSSVEECQAQCDATPSCVAVDTDGKGCYAKSHCEGEVGSCSGWCGYRVVSAAALVV